MPCSSAARASLPVSSSPPSVAVGSDGRPLVGLDPLPVLLDLLGRRGVPVGEHVRVPTHELGDQAPRHVVDIEGRRLGLLGDPRVEEHLQQHVAELLGEVAGVGLPDRLEHLVRLLDEVGRQALVGLLGVPRAAARRTQAVHDGHRVEQPRPGDVP